MSKKELRELRKQEKLLQRHQKLVTAAQDTVFSLVLPSMLERTHYGQDEAIFNFSGTMLTMLNVVMPVTDDEHMEKIPSYITRIRSYDVKQSPSGDLTVTTGFLYSKWRYALVLEKSQENHMAIAKFYVRDGLLGSYEGKIQP